MNILDTFWTGIDYAPDFFQNIRHVLGLCLVYKAILKCSLKYVNHLWPKLIYILAATVKGAFLTVFVTSSGKQTQKSMVFILPSPKSLTRRLQWRLESMFYSLMNTMAILRRHYHLNESDLKEVFGLIADLHAKTTCLVQK